MSSEDVLGHRTRKVVYNYISNHPGAAFGTIKGMFDLAEGTLRYHLQYLERHKIIYSQSMGNYRCYYPTDKAGSSIITVPDIDPNTLTELQKQIVTIIRQKPGTTVSELESYTRADKRVLRYNLKVLKDQMIIWKVGNGRSTCYEIATKTRLQNELIKFVTMKFLKGEITEEAYLTLKGEIEKERLKE